LNSLHVAANRAIKTEGYICETLSAAKAISSQVNHISSDSVAHMSRVSQTLVASLDADYLPYDCTQNVFGVLWTALDAASQNSTCIDGYGSAAGHHMKEFLDNLEASFKHLLTKSSSSLLTGQALSFGDASVNSSNFRVAIRKLSLARDTGGALEALNSQSDTVSYSLPTEVLHDERLSGKEALKVLFSEFQRAPNMNGISPISPAVSLSLATEDGGALPIFNLTRPINITIPLTLKDMCSVEAERFSGAVQCKFWDEESGTYSREGCTTHVISAELVTCMCTHLSTFILEPMLQQCSDAVRGGDEACDDGNSKDGDGCSADCRAVEPGFTCVENNSSRSICGTVCGDGYKAGDEQCDDKNVASNDGCSATCAVECGYECDGGAPTSRDTCTTQCGDGIKAGSEACDDGNFNDNDGCSADCSFVENGYTCTESGNCHISTCRTTCGDGLSVGLEDCDDGNSQSGDGCSNTCSVECGYVCMFVPVAASHRCISSCGDGKVAARVVTTETTLMATDVILSAKLKTDTRAITLAVISQSATRGAEMELGHATKHATTAIRPLAMDARQNVQWNAGTLVTEQSLMHAAQHAATASSLKARLTVGSKLATMVM